MNHLERIQELLPPIYAVGRDAVLAQFLDVVALEMEALQEDIERMRRTHWVRQAYRLEDVEKLADLVGIDRLAWETLPLFRARLLARVEAQLRGALGPAEIKEFVYDYLIGAEDATEATFVPGLQELEVDQAFAGPTGRQRLLALVENPRKTRRSGTLLARAGRVPYLFRWTEENQGLAETVAAFEITGLAGGRTAVPILVNRTTGDLLGYRAVLRHGQTLVIRPAGEDGASRALTATIDGRDVAGRLFSMSSFVPGVPFSSADLDAEPRLPRMTRGANEWIFLSVGLYDVKGLNSFFFAIAGEQLREGVFDETFFDSSLFPSGAVAKLQMQWIETEPASFEVRVPRYIVAEEAAPASGAHLYANVAEALRDSIDQLHAAGVRAVVAFEPFVERQRQQVRAVLSWQFLDPERATAGRRDTISLGGRFGESGLEEGRFE